MRVSRPLLAALLAVGLLISGLARVGQHARAVWVYYRQTHWEDEVTRVERGFAPLRAHLVGHHRVGYASGIPNDLLMDMGSAEQTWRYFITRYAIAPVILSRRPDVVPLVADFESVAALDDFARTHGFAIRYRQGGLGLLATVLALAWAIEPPADRDRPLCLTGLFAGLASLTKTEGHLVAVAGLAAVALVTSRRHGVLAGLRRSLLFLSTAAPLVAWGTWLLLRHAQVASEYVFGLLQRWGPSSRRGAPSPDSHRGSPWFGAHPEAWLLAMFPAPLSGPRSPLPKETVATVAILLGVVAGACYVVYLVTTYPLDCQLTTSLHRLFVQYWPAYVALLALACPAAGEPDHYSVIGGAVR